MKTGKTTTQQYMICLLGVNQKTLSLSDPLHVPLILYQQEQITLNLSSPVTVIGSHLVHMSAKIIQGQIKIDSH